MMPGEVFVWLLYIVIGFLSGSILFCKIIPQYVLKIDICAISKDHNPGAANVFINCGIFWGMICLGLDILKGYIPILLALHHLNPDNTLFALVMAAPVLGHAIAPFNHFQGGKCISTSFGEMLALYTVNRIGVLLALVYILFSTIIRINPNRLRSMVAFGVFGMLSAVILTYRNQYSIAVGCVLVSLIAFAKHTVYFTDN